MRNPERIPEVMDKLEAFWKEHPDWRLGQLLINAVRYYGWQESDLWEAEDGVLIRGIELMEAMG